jgi:hypothetical protein
MLFIFLAGLGKNNNNKSYGLLDESTSTSIFTLPSTSPFTKYIPFKEASAMPSNDSITRAGANFGSSASISTCQRLSVQAVNKSVGGNSAIKAIHNNNNATHWDNNRLGSWLQLDLGSSTAIVCSVDIAWYKGNISSYNFDISISNDGTTFNNVLSRNSSGTTNWLEKYTMPSNTIGRYIKITVHGNSGNNHANVNEIVLEGEPQPHASLSTSPNYDNFENGTYTLSDGQISPNGKWKDAYTGFGSVGVQQDPATGNHYLFEQPKTSISRHQTSSSMVLTTQQYSDFEMDLDMKTVAQLRENSRPNTWETAWVFWHYTDEFHYYALTLKIDGLQIEKKDNDNRDDSAEIHLLDISSPTTKLGEWQHIKIRHEGANTPHIQVWVDSVKVADFVDDEPRSSAKLSTGNMGLYNEDARVNFDNVNINVLNNAQK